MFFIYLNFYILLFLFVDVVYLFLAVFLLNAAAVILGDILPFVSVGHVVENARLVDVDGAATVQCRQAVSFVVVHGRFFSHQIHHSTPDCTHTIIKMKQQNFCRGTHMMSLLAAKHQVHIVGGVIEEHPISKKLYNTVAAFGPAGEEVARYRKIHLSKVQVGPDKTSEGDVLQRGSELSFFDIAGEEKNDPTGGRGWRVGLACCFDLRFRELSDMLVRPPPNGIGADILVYPSSWLKSTGDMGHWETLLSARALDGQCYVMGVSNAQDDDQECVAYGHSQVVGPLGNILSVCQDHRADEVVCHDLSMEVMENVRRSMIPLESCRRKQVYEDALRNAQSNYAAMMRPPTGLD